MCPYSDFFIEEADAWRPEAWGIVRRTQNILWLIQTKRADRVARCLPPGWGEGYFNAALGVSVEDKAHLSRIPFLQAVPAALRYLDISPCLEDVCPDLGDYLEGIGLVIIAGETGCGLTDDWRPFNLQWARNVRDLCQRRSIPFRFGHAAGRPRCPSRLLDGQEWNGLPEIWPKAQKSLGLRRRR